VKKPLKPQKKRRRILPCGSAPGYPSRSSRTLASSENAKILSPSVFPIAASIVFRFQAKKKRRAPSRDSIPSRILPPALLPRYVPCPPPPISFRLRFLPERLNLVSRRLPSQDRGATLWKLRVSACPNRGYHFLDRVAMSSGRFNFRKGAPAWSSSLRSRRRCSTQKPSPCAVVVIDDDDDRGDSDPEVFIVDADAAGKASPTTSRCQTKKGEGSPSNVINLDDDEEEVEEVSRGDTSGPSTAHDAGSPSATTPGLNSQRNGYWWNHASESDLSEGLDSESDDSESDANDGSDCEIMDDTCGTARKMWESAASLRKRMPSGGHEGKEGMATASTSSSGSETQPGQNAEGIFGSKCQVDELIFRYFEAAEKGGAQNSTTGAMDCPAEYNLNGNMEFSFSDAWKHEQSSTYGAKDGHGPFAVSDAEECLNENVSDAKDSRGECHINEEVFQHFSHADKEGDQSTTGAAKVDCDPYSGQDANECSNRNGSNGKGPGSSASPTLDSDTAGNDKTTHFHNDAVPKKASDGIQSPHLDQTFVDSFVSAKRVFPASSSPYWNDGSPPMSVSTPEKMDERIPEGVCSRKDQSPSGAHNVTSGSCSLPQKDLVDDPNGSWRFTLVEEASDFQDSLIGEREKLKETAEFKRAAEEEWASRQRQLQIQVQHFASFS
jgi:hypothetical protein